MSGPGGAVLTPELVLVDSELAEAQRQTTNGKAAMSSPEAANGMFFADQAQPVPPAAPPDAPLAPPETPLAPPAPEPAAPTPEVEPPPAAAHSHASPTTPMIDVPLGTLIFRAGLLAEEQLEDALQEGMRTGKRLGEVLIERGWLNERDLGRLLAGQKGLPFVEVSASDADPAALRTIPEEKARLQATLPLRYEDGQLVVAVADPSNELLIENLRRTLGAEPRLVVAPYADLKRAIEDAYAAAPATVAPEPVPAPQTAPVEPQHASEPPQAQPVQAQPEPVAAPVAPPAVPETQPQPPAQPAEPVVVAPEPQPEPEPVPSLSAPVPAPLPTVLPPAEERTSEPAVVPALQPTAPEPAAVQPVAEVTPAVEAPAPLIEQPLQQPEAPAPLARPVEPAAVVPEPEPRPEPAPAPPPLRAEGLVETPPSPAPVPEPQQHPAPVAAGEPTSVHLVVLRLREGDAIDVGSFSSAAEASARAQEVVRQIASAEGAATWPYFADRYLRPDAIISVDLVEESADKWLGSAVRRAWAQP